ncbi:MAG: NAD(P)H-binding protein [Spirochaetaceae bacterium]|nr:MAG: NAD(P)H-binding protein [Spirochaetaceae bacterium]
MDELHVVLGAGGNIGKAVVDELVSRDKPVRGVSRSGRVELPGSVEQAAVDALDRGSLAEALSGAAVVYHCIGVPYPQWADTLRPVMSNLIEEAAQQVPRTRVVYADNLYCYGRVGALRGPIREDTPHLADGKKGRLRSQLIQQLLRADQEGRLRATIGQGSDFFGPRGDNSILDFFVFQPLMSGRRISILADLDREHSFIYLPDFGRFLVDLAEDDRAYGQVWILPHMEVLTYRELLHRVFQEAGIAPEGKIRTMSKAVLTVGSFMSRMIREVREVAYQTQIDWVADWSKYRNAIGGEPTSIGQAIRETLNWYRQQTLAEKTP